MASATATAASKSATFNSATTSPNLGDAREKPRQSLDKTDERDLVTIAVESGLAGKAP